MELESEFTENLQNLKNLVRTDSDEITDSRNNTLFLDEIIVAVKNHLSSINPPPRTAVTKEILQSISLLAEAYDQCGKYKEAVQIIKSWAQYYLDNISPPKFKRIHFSKENRDSEFFFAVTKQKVWICLIYAHLLYRDENYESALKYLETCEYVVDRIRSKETDKQKMLGRRLYGTRSRIAFQKAHILYELGEIESAEESSREALRLSIKRLENKKLDISNNYAKNSNSYKDKIEKEEVLARQTYAKILSFCQAKHLRASGKLEDCLQMQQFGRICLHDLNQNFLQRLLFDVEICITKRLLAKEDFKTKRKILIEIEQLLKEFKKAEIQYRRKLLIEKVTILTQLLQLLKSSREKVNDELDKYSGMLRDSLQDLINKAKGKKWRWRVYLLESRAAEVEKDYKHADEAANEALSIVADTSHKSGLIQAKLQKGRVYRFENDYDAAIKVFKEILKLCRTNDSTYRLCQLSLAECYFLRGKKEDSSRDIQYGFEHWVTYKNIGSENGNVVAMAKRLQNKFNDLEKSFFLLERNSENFLDLNVRKNTQKLREWLYAQALLNLKNRRKPITNENLARELGFSSPSSINNYFKTKNLK